MSYAETNGRGKTGKWIGEANWSEPGGTDHRLRRRFETKKDADRYEAFVRATHEEPPWVEAKSPTSTFGHVAQKFKEANHDWVVADDGVTNASRLEFAVKHLGNLSVKSVRGPALVKYVETIRKHAGGANGPSNRTINYYLNAVSKVLKYAHMLDMIDGMPPMPRQKNSGRSRDALTWGEEDAICAAMPDRTAWVVRVLAATGMRAGELHALTPDQIEVQKEYAGISLKAEQTKAHRARWVPLVHEAAEKLRALIANKGIPNQCVVYDKFKSACKVSGASPKHCVHSLRHTFITRLGESGAATLDIAMVAGHSTGLITQTYYHPQEKKRLFDVVKIVQVRVGGATRIGATVTQIGQYNQGKGGRVV